MQLLRQRIERRAEQRVVAGDQVDRDVHGATAREVGGSARPFERRGARRVLGPFHRLVDAMSGEKPNDLKLMLELPGVIDADHPTSGVERPLDREIPLVQLDRRDRWRERRRRPRHSGARVTDSSSTSRRRSGPPGLERIGSCATT